MHLKYLRQLETIFSAIRGVEHPIGDFSLKGWIKQGVFLLNKTPILWTCTDKTKVVSDHILSTPERFWGDITKNICLFIKSIDQRIPFLLFGTKAMTLKNFLPSSIVSPHPSGRNETKTFTDEPFLQTSSIVNWRDA